MVDTARSLYEKMGGVRQSLQVMEQRLMQSILVLKQRQNMCTPIGKLPDEIIEEILEYCALEMRYEWEDENIVRFPSAFFLCARWRRIAVCLPALWSYIRLPVSLNILRLFQRRNGHSCLDVLFDETTRNWRLFESDVADTRAAFCEYEDIITQLIPRVSQLHMKYNRWSDGEWGQDLDTRDFFLEVFGTTQFSSLGSLKITNVDGGEQNPYYGLDAPALKKFSFRATPMHLPFFVSHCIVDLSWSLEEMRPKDVLDVLSHFNSLERCVVINKDPYMGSNTPSLPVISFPNLQSLTLSLFSPVDLKYLVDHLDTPRLMCGTFGILDEFVTDDSWQLSVTSLLGPYFSECDQLRIFDKRLGGYGFALASKAGRQIEVSYEGCSFAMIAAVSLARLAQFPCNLTSLVLKVQSFPPTPDLIEALTSWSSLMHIHVHTQESELEKILTALAHGPNVTCPRLKTIEYRSTALNTARVEKFRERRKYRGMGIHELSLADNFVEEVQFRHLLDEASEDE
ncbi:hypothetical protein SISSUDRAFT_1124380 [Sistotremastrum suecicum HHB10207 ss-3]|uniref:F-box domain-containing protein n=1 Tax=Sistotremastrum suecicum HHB10207 ss-3 TaxID=1314776 RepID=A0A166J0T0_9AGAM|nr:hypothetical protein SISSUDRAFT_1124380 [Sistotremastrum suecicum HHB10207 ss-3]